MDRIEWEWLQEEATDGEIEGFIILIDSEWEPGSCRSKRRCDGCRLGFGWAKICGVLCEAYKFDDYWETKSRVLRRLNWILSARSSGDEYVR